MDSDVIEELQYLNAGGFTYAYRRYGDYEAPAVVLLMGLGLSMEAWPEGIISGLLAEGFQVITPDNRDAGASSRFTGWQPGRGDVARAIVRTVLGLSVTGEYALEDMALDIERLLDHLGIRRVHVAGVSMGGMIAQVFATQCPNRVATLTSISSAVGNPKTGLGSLRAILAVAGTGDASSPEALKAHFKTVLTALSGSKYRPTPEELEDAIKSAPRIGYDPIATRRQLIALLASGNRAKAVGQLRTPTLVIHGTEDPLLPFAAGEETARLIRGAKLIPVEGLGHQLPPSLMGAYAKWIAEECHAHPA